MIVLETIVLRWYAFGFIALFAWAATADRPAGRAVRFLALASGVALLAELSSTRTGFPYGDYHYTAATRGDEIYLFNVPLFVPLSFGVVVWAGRALAATVFKSRTRAPLVLLGALFATLIDAVMDPMTLRGVEWFLGRLYGYDGGGFWFGVPLSNFAGWFFISAVIILVDDLLERRHGIEAHPLRGPTVAALICAFFIVIAVVTGNFAIAGAQLVITAGLAAVAWPGLRRSFASAD